MSDDKTQPKKRGCRKGCLVFVLLAAFPVWWFCIRTEPLRIAKETTYFTGPLTADGKRIDYFRAVEEKYYPPEMKTDDNGYRILVRACGDMANRDKSHYDPKTYEHRTEKVDPEPFRLQVYEKLGLDPNVKPTLKLESPDTYLGRLAKDQQTDSEAVKSRDAYYRRGSQTDRLWWTFDDYPELKNWLAENTAGIDLLGEAVRKPTFRMPMVRDDENKVDVVMAIASGDYQMVRDWCRAASGRAYYRIGIGDIDGAIDDAMAIHRLARIEAKHGTLVAGLVGIALEGVALAIGIGENPKFAPSKEQLKRYFDELDKLPPMPPFVDCLDMERFYCLSAFQEIHKSSEWEGWEDVRELFLNPWMRWSYDKNIVLEQANKAYDALVAGEPCPLLDEKASWNPIRYLTTKSRSKEISKSLLAIFLPAMQACREAWRRNECSMNLKRLTLALLLYEKEHGSLPEGDWREAVKPYLGAEPNKYFHCPSFPDAQDKEHTHYALIGGKLSDSPKQMLLAEVFRPQKLGEGDGRFPQEKVTVYSAYPSLPPDDFDGLGGYHPGNFNASFRSGSIQAIAVTTSKEKLQSFLDGTQPEPKVPEPSP